MVLKVLFFLSIAALATGLIRCSMEATAPVSEDVSVIGVAPVTVLGLEDALGAQADTLARRVTAVFADALAEVSGVPVEAANGEWTGDARVELRLRPWEGQLRLTGEVLRGEGGRLAGVIRVEGPLEVLDGMTRAAAHQAARALRLEESDRGK